MTKPDEYIAMAESLERHAKTMDNHPGPAECVPVPMSYELEDAATALRRLVAERDAASADAANMHLVQFGTFAKLTTAEASLAASEARVKALERALERITECAWEAYVTEGSSMLAIDYAKAIARAALQTKETT